MSAKTVTRNEAIAASDRYGALIIQQARMFTEDDLKVAVVYEDAIWEIPIILTRPETHLSHFSQIMQYIRTRSIQLLNESPYFDPWDMWKQEPVYFSLLDKSRDLTDKEIFWYRYFRDLPDERIAERYNLSADKIQSIMKEMLREMTSAMIRYLNEQHENGDSIRVL